MQHSGKVLEGSLCALLKTLNKPLNYLKIVHYYTQSFALSYGFVIPAEIVQKLNTIGIKQLIKAVLNILKRDKPAW